MDMLHGTLKWIDHNRWVVLGLILGVAFSALLMSCQPMTASILTAGEKVSEVQLESEAAVIEADATAKLKQLELARADIERQKELRTAIVETVGGVGTAIATGTVNPQSVIASIVQLMSLAAVGGLTLDNRRKGKLLKEKKDKA